MKAQEWTQKCKLQNKETSGTCSFFNCDANRGSTECINGKCICADGYFTQDGETCISCPGTQFHIN